MDQKCIRGYRCVKYDENMKTKKLCNNDKNATLKLVKNPWDL